MMRVHEAIEDGRLDADGYQPQPRLFASARQAAAASPSQDDLVGVDDFDEGDTDASGRKCKNLLNKNVGLSDLNSGRCAYLSGVLKSYKVLIESLQRADQPEQHLVARRIRQLFMVLKTSWIGSPQHEPVYACRAFREWCEEMHVQGKDDLVNMIKTECRSFASVFHHSAKERLKSTWNYIQCLELIDPMGPDFKTYTSDSVWDALKDLCVRRNLDFDECREDIVHLRSIVPNLDSTSQDLIVTNLCEFCRRRRSTFVNTSTPSPTPEYDKLCAAIFSIPLTSAFVETLFSKMAYNQHKVRASLKDKTMSSILHIQDAVLPDPQERLRNSVCLKLMTPKSFKDKLHMDKKVGTVVCDVFDGNRFHGVVSKVIYHELHAQYMYHVTFDDGDECDYWRQELEMIRCHCDDGPDA